MKLAHEISKSTGRSIINNIICPDIACTISVLQVSPLMMTRLMRCQPSLELLIAVPLEQPSCKISTTEAEQSGEGRGEVLKEIWRESHDRALFFRDQKLNSKAFLILATNDDINIHWAVGTGSKGNRWSLISYRIG